MRDFSGGVYGVDVFFVISGYLITSTLLKEHAETRSISLRDFYHRRASASPRVRFRMPNGVVMITILLSWQDPGMALGGSTVVSLAAAVVLSAAGADGWLANLLGHPILAWIGQRSCRLYLWHYPVMLAGLLHFHLPQGLTADNDRNGCCVPTCCDLLQVR